MFIQHSMEQAKKGVAAMRRKASVLFVMISILGLSLTACSGKETNEASAYYESSLPETFSYDVSIKQIGADIDQYIAERNLEIERDTEEYGTLLHDFCFSDFSDLTDTTIRFYQAYASVYLSDPTGHDTDKTIGEIREENQ